MTSPSSARLPRLDIIRNILDNASEDAMPNQRYQDPKIQRRSDVARPFWFIRPYTPVFVDGSFQRKQQTIRLGYCDEMSVREAKAAKEQAMAGINSGRMFFQAQIPFPDMVKRYLEAHVTTLSPTSQKDYRCKIEKHILPSFQDCQLCDISADVVQRWLNQKAADGLSWNSRAQLLSILSSIFTQAELWNLWDGRNPCTRIKIGRRIEKYQKRIPSAEELNRFLDALPSTSYCSSEFARCIVLVAVVAGLRIGEVLGLQRRDVDAHDQTITVRRAWKRGEPGEPKTDASKRTRQIGALTQPLLALSSNKPEDAYIFGMSNGRPTDDRNLQQAVFMPAAKAAGIYHPGFGMHEFRRLNVTWRQEVGATPFEAMKAAGHSRPSTTWLYTITDVERERQHVEKILERVQGGSLARMAAVGGTQ